MKTISPPPCALTGRQIVGLMRRHRVTIRALAARMNITLKRIRHVRAAGLPDRATGRDWIECITGTDPGHEWTLDVLTTPTPRR